MFQLARLLLPLLLCLAPALQAQDDGPYVIWSGQEAQVFRVRGGQVEVEKRRGPFPLALPTLPPPGLVLNPAPMEPAQAEFEAPEKIFALSDIHGQLDRALQLLQAHRVVDRNGRWTFGRGHLVIVGDTMDRGPQVTEAYWFFRGLETQAGKSGGRVHVLLGNHELMVLAGNTSHLHLKYAQPPAGLPPIAVLYGPDSEIGRWLRCRPTLLRLGEFLFVHGGISPSFLARGLDIPKANRMIQGALGLRSVPGTTTHFLVHEDGPLWYRGLLPRLHSRSTDQDIGQALAVLQAQAFVVGHTTLDHVRSFHQGRVYAIDAGLMTGKAGEGWTWEKGKAFRALADGQREAIPSR